MSVRSIFVAVALVGCHRELPPPAPKSITTALILADVSSSSGDTKKLSISDQRCPEILAQIHQVMSLPNAKHLDVAVYITGDVQLTSGEPKAILPWTRFSTTHQLFGKPISRQEQQHTFLKLVDQRCRENLREATGSPIVLGMQRSVESLAAHKAELTNHKEQVATEYLSLISDLRDNHYPSVEQYRTAIAIAIKKGQPRPAIPPNLPHINLGDLKTTFCGISEYFAKGESAFATEALIATWSAIMISKDPLTFAAACPRESLPPTIAAKSKVRP